MGDKPVKGTPSRARGAVGLRYGPVEGKSVTPARLIALMRRQLLDSPIRASEILGHGCSNVDGVDPTWLSSSLAPIYPKIRFLFLARSQARGFDDVTQWAP